MFRLENFRKVWNAWVDGDFVFSTAVAAETFDYDIIDMIYAPHDSMTLMVALNPDGSTDLEVVASIAKGLRAGHGFPEDVEALKKIEGVVKVRVIK